jgi:diacylglycerol kinase (ATP)
LGIVVNLPVYAMGLRIAPDARPDDGLFDLRLFEHGSAFQMFRYFYRVAANTHHSLPDVRTLAASRIRVESDVPAPIQVDGDPAGWTPAEVQILPSALDVFAPPVGTA